MTDSLAYETLTGRAQVESLAGEWEALLERSPASPAFSSPAWFLASCRARPGLAPHVVTARRGGELAGLLPLAVNRSNEGDELVFGTWLCDYNDAVVSPEEPEAAAGLLRRALGEGHRMRLSFVRPDSACVRALAALGEDEQPERPAESRRLCPWVRLPGSYEQYLEGRSSEARKSLRRAWRRAAAEGFEARELTPGEIAPTELAPSQLAETFLAVHLARFGDSSCFARPDGAGFARELLPELFARRRLRVFALLRAGRPAALDLCMADGAGLRSWNGGFLPEAGPFSPGRLLTDQGIRRACELGLAEYDFLRGTEAYKESWATDRREILELVWTETHQASSR